MMQAVEEWANALWVVAPHLAEDGKVERARWWLEGNMSDTEGNTAVSFVGHMLAIADSVPMSVAYNCSMHIAADSVSTEKV